MSGATTEEKDGTPVVPSSSLSDFLANYDPSAYPPFAVSVDLAIFTIVDGELAVLLIERAEHPYMGFPALPGGFTPPNESTDDAARARLCAETGIDLGTSAAHLEQLGTYSDPDRDPRMRVLSVAYVAFVANLPAPVPGPGASSARFVPVSEVASLAPLAFDHDQILTDALERTRAKLEYTTLATSFVAEPFTISELRAVYESAWNTQLHPANFARKVLSCAGFVVPTGEQAPATGPGRPAATYRAGDAQMLMPPMLRPTGENRD